MLVGVALALATQLMAGTTPTSAAHVAVALVSNLNQTQSSVVIVSSPVAVRFTTGTSGATLTSVTLYMRTWPAGITPTIELRQRGTGHTPGSIIATLTNPTQGTMEKSFTAPANTVLAANTTYTIQINSSSTDYGNNLQIGTTDSSSEDAGKAEGWSIANKKLLRPDDTWEQSDDVTMLAIVRTVKAPRRPTDLTGLVAHNKVTLT